MPSLLAHLHSRRALVAALAGSTLALGALPSARASVLIWSNPAGGLASAPANWNPNQAPTGADILNYNLNANYLVSFNAGAPSSAQQNCSAGNITLSAASSHTIGGQLVVGLNPGSISAVTLGGTFNVGGIVAIGGGAGSTALLNVPGSLNATLNITSAAGLRVGNSASGTLNITGGGFVNLPSASNAGVQIGALAGSSGAVTVSGHVGNNSSLLLISSPTAGNLTVGALGSGSLTIADAGVVSVRKDTLIAPNPGSTGLVTVNGGAFFAELQNFGDLHLAHNTTAAAAGNGTIRMNSASTDEAVVTVSGVTFVGDPDGGTGLLDIRGGLFETRSLFLEPGRGTLSHTGGILKIGTSGVFNPTLAGPYVITGPDPLNPPILQYSFAQGLFPGGFIVGGIGAGVLKIQDGSIITATAGGAATLVVGNAAGSSGEISIRNAASRLNAVGAGVPLTIGNAGAGLVTVVDGRLDAGDIIAGASAGSSGALRIDGGTVNAADITLGRPAGGSVVSLDMLGSGVLNCLSLLQNPGATMTLDDAVITASGAGQNIVRLRGATTMSNGAEIAADFLQIVGTVAGSGNLYGIVTIQVGGGVSAVGGDLEIGSPALAPTGLVNLGTLDVGAQSVRILNGTPTIAGDITIAGGQLFATGLTFNAGDSLSGHGGVTAAITAAGGAFTADDASGLVFNGPVSADDATTWSGTKFTFAAGGGFTGQGAIPAIVATEEEAAIAATGGLSLGDDGVNDAVVLAGPLHIGPHSVTLRSDTRALLGALTTIEGGDLTGPQSNARTINLPGTPPIIPPSTRTVFDVVPIELPAGSVLEGQGAVHTKVRTLQGSVINLTGPLSFPASGSPVFTVPQFDNGRTFVDWEGTLNVGPHSAAFLIGDQRFGPSAVTTIGGGRIVASLLRNFGILSGHGTINIRNTNPPTLNAGTIRPGAAGGEGIGTLTFNTGIDFQSGGFFFEGLRTSTIEVDISGDQGFAHDAIVITQGDAQLSGILRVSLLDAEPPPGASYPILQCQSGSVQGEFNTVELPVMSRGALHVVYRPSSVEVVYCTVDFNRDGFTDPDDLADYIGCFFSIPPCAEADINADGHVDPDDLSDFIGAFFAGCP